MKGTLDPEQWKQVFELLDVALDLPPAEREAWLEKLHERHAALRPALREMLSRSRGRETHDFLARLPEFTISRAADGEVATSVGNAAPGMIVGPYRLLRELGRGGMGSVWLAERVDGAFKRSVALKLPHVGWTDALAERLKREREILAGLDHPNIARLYDAGVDEQGRPFLAMEHIEGQPLDSYRAECNPSVRECLYLILQVARAVAYAHSRLIVHRDLKPGNIMVSTDGAVHLLDFGVAKLLAGDVAGETHLTQLAGRMLTPDYASPEQIKGEPISAASDVYSLAVVAYELLVGARPYRLKRNTASELERAITEVDVPAASGAATDTARKHELRGDLDAILNKALKKNPAERYATAEAFANDLERYFARQPVLARPDSSGYRLRKFVARNRVGLGVAAIVAIALIGATLVSLWQAHVADEQRNRALTLLARSEAVSDFVNVMLTEVATPDQPITIDELLKRSESLVSQGVTENPEHQAVILQALASYYESSSSAAKAEQILDRALALTESSNDVGLRTKLLCQRAFARSMASNPDAEKKAIEQALAAPEVPPEAAAQCFRNLAYIAQNNNDAPGALRYARAAQERLQQSERADPLMEAGLLGDLGYAYAQSGDAAEADRYYAASIRKFVEIGRAEHPTANTIRNNWGLASSSAGDITGALRQFEEAVEIARKHAIGGEAPIYLVMNHALQLDTVGRYDEALAEYDRAIATARKMNNEVFVAVGTLGEARVHLLRGEVDVAQKMLDDVKTQLGKTISPNSPTGTNALIMQARIDAARGNFAAAADAYTKIAELWESRGMSSAGPMAATLRARSDVYLQQGNTDAALADAQRALTIGRKLQGTKPHSSLTGLAHLLLSRIYAQRGQQNESVAAARDAFAQLSSALGPDSPDTRTARNLMAASTQH
jgi:serine/threonine-protein kinase